MIQTLEEHIRLEELRASFVADALASREEVARSREGFDAEEVHEWLRARIAGQSAAPRPRARKLSK